MKLMKIEELKRLITGIVEKNKEIGESLYFSASFTDKYELGSFDVEEKHGIKDVLENISKLLELRIFNNAVELKATREHMGIGELSVRTIDESVEGWLKEITGSNLESDYETFEQCQLLDIDLKRSNIQATPGMVYTATGGQYYMPIELSDNSTPCLRVKYYVPKYNPENPATIHASITDWRCMGIEVNNR